MKTPKPHGRPPANAATPRIGTSRPGSRRNTYSEVRKRLFDEHEEFSALFERLLKDWSGRPPKKRPPRR